MKRIPPASIFHPTGIRNFSSERTLHLIRLQGMGFLNCESEVRGLLAENPWGHLIGVSPDRRITKAFKNWQADTTRLAVVPVHLIDESTKTWTSVLAVVGLGGRRGSEEKYLLWIIVDGDQKMIGVFENKISSLPSQFIQDEAAYEQLADFTYQWSDRDNQRGTSSRVPLEKDFIFGGIVERFLPEIEHLTSTRTPFSAL
ncbi:hypothetical protein A3H38_02365 [candidate division WOR-1 bacterium RIFCSPLOWO2_02_FULL_46_20]|uniref:Uncharacterized protein n=1 Tax=candidate division WOR-1 bacterium RIFCSPLOWO2_02_FULL_46_20 TaxID=1802567 RepID=A0A1F4R8N0_UNCSA|nr:MAG: hypothetical protein A3H38_02365 [candidate division WOR-1 bacterium RIFCSPLOWO2_02_FULL_46_20]